MLLAVALLALTLPACKARRTRAIEAAASHDPRPRKGGVVVLSSPGTELHDLAQDSSFVYFIKGHREESRLLSVPKAGGKTRVLALIGDNVDVILPGDSGVIVGGWGGIHRVASSASSPERLYRQRVFGLVGEGANLYFSTQDTIYRMPRAGGSPSPLATGQQNYTVSMGVDGGFVYWVNTQHKALMRVPVEGGKVEDLGGDVFPDSGHAILFDADFAYYYQSIPRSFRRIPKKGGKPEVLTTARDHFQGWALVGDALYYGRGWGDVGGGMETVRGRQRQLPTTRQGKGGLVRVSLSGRTESELAELTNGKVEGVAVDATHAYWLDAAAGEICKIPK